MSRAGEGGKEGLFRVVLVTCVVYTWMSDGLHERGGGPSPPLFVRCLPFVSAVGAHFEGVWGLPHPGAGHRVKAVTP